MIKLSVYKKYFQVSYILWTKFAVYLNDMQKYVL